MVHELLSERGLDDAEEVLQRPFSSLVKNMPEVELEIVATKDTEETNEAEETIETEETKETQETKETEESEENEETYS